MGKSGRLAGAGGQQERQDTDVGGLFLYDLDIMVKVSKLLGKESEARRYADLYRKRKDFFLRTYVDKATARTISSGADGPEKGNR